MGARRLSAVALLGAILPLAIGCAGRSPWPAAQEPAAQEPTAQDSSAAGGVFMEKGAVVLTGAALTDGPGSLLETMRGKIPNFRMQRPAGGACPEISLRGHPSFTGLVNPDVYVDGARATDTCILDGLRAHDVERVEVYPMGFTTRPGYRTHAPGLILVFMRD